MKTPTPTELEATRVARFAAMPGRTDVFAIQAALPNAGLVVRKVLGSGVVDPAVKPSTIRVEHPFSMTFVEVPPGEQAPLHAHSTEEVFFVVDGTMTFFWGERGEYQIEIGQYDTVTMPKHVYRGFTNRTDRPVRMMVTVEGTKDEARGSVTYPPEIVAQARAAGITLD